MRKFAPGPFPVSNTMGRRLRPPLVHSLVHLPGTPALSPHQWNLDRFTAIHSFFSFFYLPNHDTTSDEDGIETFVGRQIFSLERPHRHWP